MPYKIIPYVNLLWIIAGVVFLLWLKQNRPQEVARIGSILGEEGGVEAGVLDAGASAPLAGGTPPAT
jgi:hypothetical protein